MGAHAVVMPAHNLAIIPGETPGWISFAGFWSSAIADGNPARLRMLWGVHPMAQCRPLNYFHPMNEQHYFQSQKNEDSAHLGSIHDHAPVRASKNNQRHAVVRPSHDEIAERAFNLFSASGYIPGHDVEHWLKAEAQLTAA